MRNSKAKLVIEVDVPAGRAVTDISKIATAANKASRESANVAQASVTAEARSRLQLQRVLTEEGRTRAANARAMATEAREADRSADRVVRAAQRQEQAVKKAAEEQERSSKRASNLRWAAAGKVGGIVESAGMGLTYGVTAPMVAAATFAVRTAMSFETAFADVRKNVDATNEELIELQKTFEQMTREVPTSFQEIAAVASDAGQLGIATKAIKGFTRIALEMGEATNLGSRDAATGLAKLGNITGMEQTEDNFRRLGSTIVELGKNGASTESQILDMTLRIAGAGKAVGMSLPDVLAYGNALGSLGVETEMGGSAISRVFVNIASAVSEGGKELARYANVARMTSAQFKKAFQQDAATAVAAFLEGLGDLKKSGVDILPILKAMGVEEVRLRDTILRVAGAGDILTKSLQTSRQGWQQGTALSEEYQERLKTAEAQLKLFQNEIALTAKEFGVSLIPALKDALEAGKPLIEAVKDLARRFSELSPEAQRGWLQVAGVAAIVGPTLVAIGKIVGAVNAIRDAWIAVKVAQAAASLPGAVPGALPGKLGTLGRVGIPGAVAAGAGYLLYQDQAARQRAAEAQIKYNEQTSLKNQLRDQLSFTQQYTAALESPGENRMPKVAGPAAQEALKQIDAMPGKGALEKAQAYLDTLGKQIKTVEKTLANFPKAAPAVSDQSATALGSAIAQQAAKAVYAGKTDASCAFFASQVLKTAGVKMESTGGAKALRDKLEGAGAKGKPFAEAKPGDVVIQRGASFGVQKFTEGKERVGYHAGIYLGGGMMRDSSGGATRTRRMTNAAASTFYTVPDALSGGVSAGVAPGAEGYDPSLFADQDKKAEQVKESRLRNAVLLAERAASLTESTINSLLEDFEKLGPQRQKEIGGRIRTLIQRRFEQEGEKANRQFTAEGDVAKETGEAGTRQKIALDRASDERRRAIERLAALEQAANKQRLEDSRKFVDEQIDIFNRRDERVKQSLSEQRDSLQAQMDLTPELAEQEAIRERIFAIERREAELQRDIDARRARSPEERQAAESRFQATTQGIDLAQTRAQGESFRAGLSEEIALLESRLALTDEVAARDVIQAEIDAKRQQAAQTEAERQIARGEVVLRWRNEERQKTEQQISLLEVQAQATGDLTKQDELLRQAEELRYNSSRTNVEREIILLENGIRQRERMAAIARQQIRQDLGTAVATGDLTPAASAFKRGDEQIERARAQGPDALFGELQTQVGDLSEAMQAAWTMMANGAAEIPLEPLLARVRELVRLARETGDLRFAGLIEQLKGLSEGDETTRRLRDTLKDIREETRRASGDWDEHSDVIKRLGVDYDKLTAAQKEIVRGIVAANEELKKTERLQGIINDVSFGIGGVLRDSFQGLFEGEEGFFESIASGFKRMLASMAAEALAGESVRVIRRALESLTGRGKQEAGQAAPAAGPLGQVPGASGPLGAFGTVGAVAGIAASLFGGKGNTGGKGNAGAGGLGIYTPAGAGAGNVFATAPAKGILPGERGGIPDFLSGFFGGGIGGGIGSAQGQPVPVFLVGMSPEMAAALGNPLLATKGGKGGFLGTAAGIAGMIPGGQGVAGILGAVGSIFGFAEGGRYPLNTDILVGERGPEIVKFDQPGTIIPNHQLNPATMAAAMAPQMTAPRIEIPSPALPSPPSIPAAAASSMGPANVERLAERVAVKVAGAMGRPNTTIHIDADIADRQDADYLLRKLDRELAL
jgi:TP901 family phage tail tape measure protein